MTPVAHDPETPSPILDLADALRSHILDGTLEPGQKLREAELAARFGVSRTPVREALAAIEREGLLLYELNKGFTVRVFGPRDLEYAYEMRALLEGHACRDIAERGLGSDVERRLLECVDAVDLLLGTTSESLGPDEHADWKRLNARFHLTLLQEVPNPFLGRLLTTVQQIPLVQHGLARPRTGALLRLYNAQHRQILRAIVYRQGTRAEFLMREHVRHACEEIIRGAQR
jgi:GntR family transcriptional regulator, vanillate catabolism transcriptional regulator